MQTAHRNGPLPAAGFAIVERVLAPAALAALDAALGAITLDAAGTRNLLRHPAGRGLVATLAADPRIRGFLPDDAVAVQCTLFEKSADRNWLVSPHQDLSLPVASRVEHGALAGWSCKEGAHYVRVPDVVAGALRAVRVHVDDCGADHGPLRVFAGSHCDGVLDAAGVETKRRVCAEHACTVARGGVLVMSPLLVHASSKALRPNRRRVLHYLYGPARLPFGLAWADVVALSGESDPHVRAAVH